MGNTKNFINAMNHERDLRKEEQFKSDIFLVHINTESNIFQVKKDKYGDLEGQEFVNVLKAIDLLNLTNRKVVIQYSVSTSVKNKAYVDMEEQL